MNLAELQRKLIAAARAHRPEDRVPHAFAQRVMARLTRPPALDIVALWNRTLWRAAAPSVAIVLLLGAWTFLSPREETPGEGLAADLETSLYATFDSQPEAW